MWYLPDDGDDPPRLACAVSRKVGSAVVRNRVRRRLRAAFEELAASSARMQTMAPSKLFSSSVWRSFVPGDVV